MAIANRILILGLLASSAVVPHMNAQIKDLAELYGGYNLTSASPLPVIPKADLSGFVAGVGIYANSWFGAAFEASKQYGTAGSPAGFYANANLHESSYMAGPQFRFLNRNKFNAAFRALLGGVQGQVFQPGSKESQTRFALMLGVGMDIGVTQHLAFRVEPGLFRTSFSQQNQNDFRISFGPVIRLGSPEH